MEINSNMSRYLREGRFQEYPDALIYVERTLSNGGIRRGLVGMVDLEQYDMLQSPGRCVPSVPGSAASP